MVTVWHYGGRREESSGMKTDRIRADNTYFHILIHILLSDAERRGANII
jgi:hypothetical protein